MSLSHKAEFGATNSPSIPACSRAGYAASARFYIPRSN
jgi:hypothetical protein